MEPIYNFDDEIEAFHKVVNKVDEKFFIYMYAGHPQEAECKGRARMDELMANGEWILLTAFTDR